eukprot:gene10774-22500_t
MQQETSPSTEDISDLISPLLNYSEADERTGCISDSLKGHHNPSAIPQNSAALTTFLLLNTMIGSGILNQPFVFENSGVIGGAIGFAFASYLTWMGLLILTDVGVYEGIYEYSGLAKRAFGRWGEILVDWSIIVGAFGSLLGYIIVIGDTLTQLFRSWGCPDSSCDRNTITSLAIAIFVSPLCLFRHFGHFAGLSIFSVITICMVLLLVIIGGPIKEEKGHVTLFNFFGVARSIGSIVFALNCAAANFQAYISTEKSSRNKTSWRSITFTAV